MFHRLLFSLLILSSFVLGQSVRYSAPFPSVSSTSPPFLVANIPPNSPSLHVCSSPANGLPCTNYAATYTAAGALCPNGQQDTPDPQPSACQATGDAQGNIGFWAAAGKYDYTVCIGTNCFGPYTITLGGGGCSGTCLLSPGLQGIVVANGIDGNTAVAGSSDIISALGFTPANDSSVVHTAGNETIAGSKTFNNDTTFGGNLNIAGNLNFTSTGPFFLQAKKQTGTPVVGGGNDFGLYLDSGNTFRCILNGGASCNFLGGVLTSPGANQNIIQPVGTEFSANNLANIRYVTPSWNWLQTDTAGSIGNLSVAGSAKTLTLTPCPIGLDLTNNISFGPFSARIAGTGTAEVAPVTGGTCTSGATSGTIIVTTVNVHAAGFTVGSAYAGIQEALNDAGSSVIAWHVVIPPGSYSIYAPIVIHQNKGELEGPGADLNCFTLSRCLQTGDLTNSNDYGGITVRGIRLRANANDAGCSVISTQETGGASGVRTVNYTNTPTPCTFKVGEFIRVDLTDDPSYWGDHVVVAATSTSVSWTQGTVDIPLQTTPGTLAHTNNAVLDNAGETKWLDLKYQDVASGSCTNPRTANRCQFNAFFDFWDDENATVDNFTSDGSGLECWTSYCGWFVYSVGNVGPTYCNGGTCAPVISIAHSNITGGCGNGVVDHNNNGLHITDTVIQGMGYANVVSSNITGNFQGTLLDNVYNESVGCPNTPYSGVTTGGVAGDLFGISSSVASFTVHGLLTGGAVPLTGSGVVPFTGAGATQFNYWIVAHDTTIGSATAPMLAQSTLNNQTGFISVNWPRIAPAFFQPSGQAVTDSITYDVIRTTGILHAIAPPSVGPYNGGCLGGSITACGSVVTGQAQTSGLIQNYVDTGSLTTLSYPVAFVTNTLFTNLPFWPGDMIIAAVLPRVFVDQVQPNTVVVGGWANGPQLYSVQGAGAENVWIGMADTGNYANGAPLSEALVMSDVPGDAGATNSVKGKLNFYHASGNPPGGGMSIITLFDSNTSKTMATTGHRAPMDAADTFIGIDNPTRGFSNSAVQLAIGASTSVSYYINSLPNNSSFLERLTASAKTFKVPVGLVETTAPSGIAGQDVCYGDSTAHAEKCSYNNGTFFRAPQVIATGATALGTGAVSSATCATTVTGTATGATTASVVHWSLASDPNAVTGYAGSATAAVVQIYAFPTANTVNFRVCNNTSGSITPGAMSVNWDVIQ